uniref:Uncharacterized protein n=1 Tax=Mycena chlorophos TaxID=658473 RepID=A0ABQ0LI20_MYCCL|nr:predicted protein [Mycena chlorophos]
MSIISIASSLSSLGVSSSDLSRLTFREPWLDSLPLLAAPFPKEATARGPLGPTHANLPRRKRSSVTSVDIPGPAPSMSDRVGFFS